MEQLIKILYTLTSSLLVPVIITLFLLLAWVLFEIGGFVAEWYSRKKTIKSWKQLLMKISVVTNSTKEAKELFFSGKEYPGLVNQFAKRGKPFIESIDDLDRVITEIEINSREICSKMNLWIRIGPMLGLMGTLIPMGPALMGLSSGNLEALTSNLVVAFSTTVTGLLIGALCSVISVQRRHWYIRDLSDIEHMVETSFVEKSVGVR